MVCQPYSVRSAVGARRGYPRRIREGSGRFGADADRDERVQLKARIEQWIQQLTDPVLYRQGRQVDRLRKVRFSLDCMARTLLLHCRIQGVLLRAQVLCAARDDFGAVAIHAQVAGRTEVFEIRSLLEALVSRPLQETRGDFQKVVEELVGRYFPKAKVLKSVVASDLEHSLSGKYVRLQFQSGGVSWLALAAGPQEDQAAIDGMLSNGLLWRDLLRERGLAGQVPLLLLAPRNQLQVLKSRLGWIRGAGRDLHLVAVDSDARTLSPVDLSDCGNLDTAVTQVKTCPNATNTDERIQRILALAPEHITWSYAGSNSIVFRAQGLEFAQLQLGPRSRLTMGLGRMAAIQDESDWARLKSAVDEIVTQQDSGFQRRNPRWSPRRERWLESLVLKDIARIDARLDSRFIYPQVPAFLAGDRGMIDILTVTREGRLAILELKVSEDIELPMQGLDYWLRVRWHHARNEFQTHGYFPGVTLSPLPPLLFFVCPQFRYHSSFPLLARHIDPAIPFIQVGINEDWHRGVRAVLRRTQPVGVGQAWQPAGSFSPVSD